MLPLSIYTVYFITVVFSLIAGATNLAFGEDDVRIDDIVAYVIASFMPVLNICCILIMIVEVIGSLSSQWKWSSKARRFVRR